jgi:hypothetical protein
MQQDNNKYGGMIFLVTTLGTILFWPLVLWTLEFNLWFILMLIWAPLVLLVQSYVPDGWEYVAVLVTHLIFTATASYVYITYFFKR